MATLHLMVGLPYSGKTTFARKLAEDIGALLLTPDVWHFRLFGDDVGHREHDLRHSNIEVIMWDVAEYTLKLGGDVILDFGFWSKAERDDFRSRADDLRIDFKIHYMDVPTEVLFERLKHRNQNLNDATFCIPKEEMKKYIPLFEIPSNDELT